MDAAFEVRGGRASKLERSVHLELRTQRLEGEWFATGVGDAVAAIRQCASKLGLELIDVPLDFRDKRALTAMPCDSGARGKGGTLGEQLSQAAAREGLPVRELAARILRDWLSNQLEGDRCE
jgi:hypothetical protein